MIAEPTLVAAGIAAHLGFFNKGEHHLYGVRYLTIALSLYASLYLALTATDTPPKEAHTLLSKSFLLFFSGLYTSLLSYRLLFHPLRSFPGPFSFKISSLSLCFRLYRLDAHTRFLDLHRRYGDFVRLGSSDLSIASPKAYEAVHGRGSRCTKGEFYDLTLPIKSMQTTRVKAEHDARRKAWGNAFNDEVLRGYETRIGVYQEEIMEQMANSKGKAIDMTEIFHRFSFDVMGDVSFGASFNMLKGGSNHWAIKLLHRGMQPLGFMFPPWFFKVLLAIPGATGDWYAFLNYCCDLLDKQLKTHVNMETISSFFIGPWKDVKPQGDDLNMLNGDCQLVIVAGSDTTAATLTRLFYELAKQPHYVDLIRSELNSLLGPDGLVTNRALNPSKILDAAVAETLRLHPPAGFLQRKTPPEGIVVDGRFIPGEMTVVCPLYVLGRNEKAFEDAEAFRPERWYSEPHMIKERSAVAPFSRGTYNCIGKPLALMTLRTTIAKIIREFDFGFEEGDDGRACIEETKTQFTTAPGPLPLRFWRRG